MTAAGGRIRSSRQGQEAGNSEYENDRERLIRLLLLLHPGSCSCRLLLILPPAPAS
jgi:hypothetical protein